MKKSALGVLMFLFSVSAFAGTLHCETALVSMSGVKKSVAEATTKNGIASLDLGTTATGYQLEGFYNETLGIVAITAESNAVMFALNGIQTAFLKVAPRGTDISPVVEVSCEVQNQ